jgi:hypothetical protein
MCESDFPLDFQVDFEPVRGHASRGQDSRVRVVSGTAGTWLLRVRVLASRIEPGARIVWNRYNIQLACGFQTTHPLRRDYLTVEQTGNATLELGHKAARTITLTVADRPLLRGDEIVLRIGDRRSGAVGSEVFWTATRGRFTLTLIDSEGERRAAADVTVDNVHHPRPDCLRILGPTVVAPGEPFHVNVIVFDRNRNVIEDFEGRVALTVPAGLRGLPEHIDFRSVDGGCRSIEGVSAAMPGVWRIGGRLEEHGLATRSNPVVCMEEPAARIYWGDLHAHGWGDSTMLLMYDRTPKLEPSDRHRQGRAYGRFDYGAPGAMSMTADEDERTETWQAYLDAFDEHDRPNRYVPFMSMEMHPGSDGDRTLILRDKGPAPMDMREPAERVYDAYGELADAFLEVHIGGAPPYYTSFRPENESLVEVCSAFANAEWLMQKCLCQGYRFAVTGASDLHLGLMGAPRAVETFRGRFGGNMGMRVRDAGFGSGPVGAILAAELTRDALWTGLRSRRTYATSGDRIAVTLDAGGATMGDVADLPDCFAVALCAHGQEPVERIDLIVGEWLADSIAPDQLDVDWQFQFDRQTMPPGAWFYFRIKQVNNEWAWTAPVWFADGLARGDDERDWPRWNHAEQPGRDDISNMQAHLADLDDYLQREGDREHFGEIVPVGIVSESVGTAARFVSTWLRCDYPVTMRWFFEFEIRKLRIDWGYDFFGPVDCWRGPDGARRG